MYVNMKIIVKDTKSHKNKGLKKGISLTLKKNKTRLCDSKIRTQDLKAKTQDVHDKCEDEFLLC